MACSEQMTDEQNILLGWCQSHGVLPAPTGHHTACAYGQWTQLLEKQALPLAIRSHHHLPLPAIVGPVLVPLKE